METLTPLARRWLMTALSAVLLPHLFLLPGWLAVFTVIVLGLGWGRALKLVPRLPRFYKLILFLLALLGFFVNFGFPAGRVSGSALLVLMAALKPLEIEQDKNARHLLLLCYFLVAAYFFSNQAISAALWLFFAVFLVTAAFTALEREDGPFFSRLLITPAFILLSASVPVALTLFLLFPRLPGPLWSFPEERRVAVTGLPEVLEMGSISRLVRSARVALRAEFTGPLPAPEKLYWRGPVFSRFDGRVWRRAKGLAAASGSSLTPSTPLQFYRVTLEAHHQPWLLALDPPFSVPPDSSFSLNREVLHARPLHQVYRYRMATAEKFKWSQKNLVDESMQRVTATAAMRNPLSVALARSWAASGLVEMALVERLLALFRQAPFRYTLEPPLTSAGGPVDGFLFQSRAGFCEHYAGAAAFLLRAAGLPARVVAGYLGGESHPLADYLVVRQYNAHAWVEVYLKAQGWVRVDPTAAVAPERVEYGIAAIFPESDSFFSFREGGRSAWFLKLSQYRDLAQFYWNYWVLGYGPKMQNILLDCLGLRKLKRWIAVLLALPSLALVLGFLVLKFAGLEKLSLPVKLYRRYCRRMGRRGIARKLSETPTAYAQRLGRELPEEAERAAEVAALYLRLRYGKEEVTAAQIKRLRQLSGR